ncbi:transcriptional regulator with XRE-family HTH domain [Saccharopolyspora lacisalsi]|uniref:Transcriptional regulator with XRE-family HTH domain n=1 Tax=Halosaccharopolyspora lacisalsi TaxID=1000566 RepID=A0A839DUC4_9PSEU|nr:transcriptional regulator with XRE-family HTH domain [Halosaccharopolyspora lacisalsi]
MRQVGLGADLRQARKKSQMSTRSVAERLGISHTSVARTEQGARIPEVTEVIALCALYGITGHKRDQFIERVNDSDGSTAWLATGPATAQQITSLVALERQAVTITDVSLNLVPGLVQTPEYARELIGTGPDEEWLLSTRLARQALLTKPGAPTVRFIVDESALRRLIGGASVMRDQLDHLLRSRSKSNVAVQVIPRSVGAHPGLDGSFVMLTYPDREPHVYIEARRVGLFLTRPQDVEPFADGIEEIDMNLLGEERSAELITEIKEGLPDE